MLLWNVPINARIRYPTVYVNDRCRANFALQIAAKPLLMAAWLLLTAYRNSLSPYLTVPVLRVMLPQCNFDSFKTLFLNRYMFSLV